MVQWMLAIWSLVPLPFLIQFVHLEVLGSEVPELPQFWKFTYCWSLAWRILSITLLASSITGKRHLDSVQEYLFLDLRQVWNQSIKWHKIRKKWKQDRESGNQFLVFSHCSQSFLPIQTVELWQQSRDNRPISRCCSYLYLLAYQSFRQHWWSQNGPRFFYEWNHNECMESYSSQNRWDFITFIQQVSD